MRTPIATPVSSATGLPDASVRRQYVPVPHNQSHLPVYEQQEVVDHAVRAVYLYSAMMDLAAEAGNAKLARYVSGSVLVPMCRASHTHEWHGIRSTSLQVSPLCITRGALKSLFLPLLD